MFVDLPQNLILMVAGAFLLGWLLSTINASLSSKGRTRKRDPRDDRIRSLEAELRVAQTEVEKLTEKTDSLATDLEDAESGKEKRDNVISHQQRKLEGMAKDLKESVLKTRELRNELSDRATENLKSEVKLREVETELEVAQASTDLLATGVLDYTVAPDGEASTETGVDVDVAANNPKVSKAAN